MNFSSFKRNHFLHQSLFLFWALWASHGLLRFLHLVRVDAYGNPIVRKMEWYIFHAFFIDLNWIVLTSIPLFAVSFLPILDKTKRLCVWWPYCLFQGLILVLTVLDHEFYRFMGGHFTPNMAQTYLNMGSGRELFGMLSEDKSIPYLPVAMFVVAFSSWSVFYWYMRSKWRMNIKTHLILILSLLAVGNLYTKVLWKGGHREARLAPVWQVYYKALSESSVSLSEEEIQTEIHKLHSEFLNGNFEGRWFYPNKDYPYYKIPRNQICQSSPQLEFCHRDEDGDGFVFAQDCNDRDSLVNPEARDIPNDGVDQDCNGVDQNPPNFVLIFLESHRGLHQGYLKDYGAKFDATPFLNKLSNESMVFTRANAAGLPTIGAFITTQLSIPEHPKKHIATGFTANNFLSLPSILKSKGYQTKFYTAADPSWDGQTVWLGQWYDEYFYSRETENDSALFEFAGQDMQKSFSEDKPFMVGMITKSNHYPFNESPTMESQKADASLPERMVKTMEYTEKHLERMFEVFKKQPWYDNTVFVIFGDHGFPLNEHGTYSIGKGLYKESTWIGQLIYSPKRIKPQWIHRPVTQLDIAPTLLALAGIETENAFVGRNILDSLEFHSREAYPILFKEYVLSTKEEGRYHLTLDDGFNVVESQFFEASDPLEIEVPKALDSAQTIDLINKVKLHRWVVENNRVWPTTKP